MLFRPSESSKRIVDFYRRYLLTTFGTNQQVYNRQLKQLLSADKAIADGPYISMSDPYEKGATLEALAKEGIVSKEILKLEKFYPRRSLYRHQEEAVRKAVRGSNLIVTTGTGSGKTESFLIPVINQLLREKEAGTLGPGVRTLIIYPMNALVNDQIRRLRELLSQMEDEPKITFGRFTGETKETYKDALQKYEEVEDDPLSSNELISREQMRETPPNILITNYAMLEYMLLRPGDNIIFSEAYAPKWQYIIFDEAHSYTGAKGIEVASLVKRVKAMLGRRDIRFILTSATLGDENSNREILRFGNALCGAEFQESSIIRSYVKKIQPSHEVADLDYGIYHRLANLIRENASDEEMKAVLADAEIRFDAGDELPEILFDMVLHDRFYYRVRSALNGKIKTVRAAAGELGLEEDDFTDFIAVASNAMRDGERLFEAKYHMFLRGMEGVFVTLKPSSKLFINRMETYKEKNSQDDIGYRVFEVSFCNNCSALFITGEDRGGYLIQKSKFYDDYEPSVFMLSGEYDGETAEEDDNLFQICAKCGAIKRAASVNGLQCGHGKENFSYLLRVKKENEPLHKCPSCHNQNSRRSILRPYYLGNEAATAVIATALYNELPGEIRHVEKPSAAETVTDDDMYEFFGADDPELFDTGHEDRIESVEKLSKQFLAFSDNRQTAAFFATYLEDTYRESLIKRIMFRIVEEEPEAYARGVLLGDFVRTLARRFEADQVFPDQSQDSLERRAWICTLKEMFNFKAKNSLLKKGGVYFDTDINIPALAALSLSEEESSNLIKALARHLMHDCAVDTDMEFDRAEESELCPAGFMKGYDRTAAGYRYIEGWSPEDGATNKRLKYLCRLMGGDEERSRRLLLMLWGLMEKKNVLKRVPMGTRSAYKLNGDKIRVKRASRLFRCAECGRITPYNVKNICENPACGGTLEIYDPRTELADDHYYRLYTELETTPMQVKEHTAQLASETAYEYQKKFKKRKINVLSCSTTFEMGVDVGSLETVFMRNMPPSPANYAQRAGRAGRSINAAAYAITFCPNNSHDLNYFKNPVAMIRGTINPPFFNISNDKIVLRHIFASAFSFFWRANPDLYKKRVGALVAADAFGKMWAYLAEKPQDLRDYLLQVVPPDLQDHFDIKGYGWLSALFDDSSGNRGLCNVVMDRYNQDIEELEKVKAARIADNKPVDSITRSINTIREQRTIEFLSKNNLIPKYGFPVDTVELYSLTAKTGTALRLNRDLFSAISEYAPGSEVVANGSLHTSRYVRKLSGYEWPTYNYAVCPSCQTLNREMAAVKTVRECRQCRQTLSGRNRQYVIPKFGFLVDPAGPKKVGLNKPERTYKGSISYIGDESQIQFHDYDVCGRHVCVGNSRMDRLAVLNESPFFLCTSCGYGEVDEKTTDRVVEKSHKNASGYNCGNKRLYRYSLGHELQTDVAVLKFTDFDISNVEEAWTILYSLLEGLSRSMSIDRNELSGCLQWYRDDTHPDGNFGFVLFDNTPGGAGYVRQLADARTLAAMLQTGYAVVRDCACGGDAADTACYSCLCNYYNQRQHDILRRRYALDFYMQISGDPDSPWPCRRIESENAAEASVQQNEPERPLLRVDFGNDGLDQSAESAADIWNNLLDDCEEEDEALIEALAEKSPERIAGPCYRESMRIVESGEVILADLMWKERKVMLFLAENDDEYKKAVKTGWRCYCTGTGFDPEELLKYIEV